LYVALTDWLFGVPGSWGIRSCSACGLAWPDPLPAPEDIPKLYARYYTHNSAPETWLARLREATSRFVFARMGYSVQLAEGVLPRMLSYVPSIARAARLDLMGLAPSPAGTVLDVGCGSGDFIARMRSLGWSVSGVDPDPAAATGARNRGLQVFCGTIADVPGNMLYDVITLNHVVEHVADPVDLLRECRKRLRPDTGTIIITTPNIKSLGHRWFKGYWRGLEVPRHLVLFSPGALSACATRAGLGVRTLRTETRIARMIYSPSVRAGKGGRNVGEQTDFKVTTKCAAYAFQALEDALALFNHDIGEEIYCVCAAPKGNDGERQ
jgi:2-polyprenyl-3-methyl-5-hydroxy-6-metoxy-1,4-benzoquinol methylase